jgi:hypothetical protein
VTGGVLALCLVLAPQSAPAPAPLVDAPTLQRLHAATAEIAKTGEAELVERMRKVLEGLGDEPKVLEKQARTWEKSVASAKPGRTTQSGAASRLRREVGFLVAQLPKLDEARRVELARGIVALDAEQGAAQEVLGRKHTADGEWLDPEQIAWSDGAKHVAEFVAAANSVVPKFERGPSQNPALVAVCGGGNVVRSHGVELHSTLSAESLERILGQALRAAALSNGLLTGKAEIPDLVPMRAVLLTSETQKDPAFDEAIASGGLSKAELAQARELNLGSFHDTRGWWTVRWRNEAPSSAFLLWHMASTWMPFGVQPCLSAGHVNWLCLTFLGTSMPSPLWREETPGAGAGAERTSAKKDEALLRQARWRAARQSLWGCRSWMIGEVRAGRDPSWVRSIVDQEGKIVDENLLKTTLVCELLQQEGRLLELMKATCGEGKGPPVFEAALKEPMPEFDARWRRWLLSARESGVLQELEAAPAPSDDVPFAGALLLLNQARGEALKDQSPEIPTVVLDDELSRAAERHARYLTLNPAQKSVWPDAHEEFAGAPGFTPEGSLAGGRAVIAFDGDPAHSVRAWLDTFYHRLPLLSPGLFGAGFGRSEEVVVLDVGSLVLEPWKDHVVVWPTPDAKDVARRFQPEMPNPVPGEDMSQFGYAVTLQLYLQQHEGHARAVLELFAGDPEPKNAVECHVITPEAPLYVELAPDNTWALIPKRALAKKTRYTARASWNDEVKTWSFTTGD